MALSPFNKARAFYRTCLCFIFLCFTLAASEASAATLDLSLSQSNVTAGQSVSVTVRVNDAKDLFSTPFYLKYDPEYLKLTEIREGGFMKGDGSDTAFLYDTSKPGRIIVGLSRLGSSFGRNGSGVLVAITFKTLKPGKTSLSVNNVKFKDSRLARMPVKGGKTTIEINEDGR